MIRLLLAILCSIPFAGGASLVEAGEPECVYPRLDQVKPLVSTTVAPAGSGFDYYYFIANQPGAAKWLVRFAVQAFPAQGAPVTQTHPSDWESRGAFADPTYYAWTTFKEPRGLAPGASAEGFGFLHAELPAIVMFLAWNDGKLPSFPEGEAPESCEGSDIVQNSFKGKTIGPKAPPANFVPLEFLNYLIALLHDSRQQGWIKVDGIHQSLLAKLLAAKRAIEAGRVQPAAGELKAFVNEVQAVSCPELTCPGNKPLTSEAYALLYFNGQYLVERLPAPGPR